MTSGTVIERADRPQLQRIIADLREGILLFEPDGALSYANASALAMHGVDGVEQLGGSARAYGTRFTFRYLNGHVLSEGEHPAQRVLAGDEVTDLVVEVSRDGETGWRTHLIRTLAVRGSDGHLALGALVLADKTEEHGAEKRFEQAFAANPAPAVICRLDDLRYIRVNEGFLAMTGHRREAVIGHSVYEIDVLEGAKSREHAVERLSRGQAILQTEARLRLPDGGSKLVIVAGQPIEVGRHACMLFTFIDLEHRSKAEAALRQSEERFAVAFRLSPIPMLISVLAGHRILDANDAFVREFGHERSGAIGRSKADLKLWSSPETRALVEQQLDQTGRVRSVEVKLRTHGGKVLDCLMSSEGVTIHDERCVLTVLQDVTVQRRSDAQLVAAVEAVMQDASWLGQKIVAKINSLADAETGDDASLDAADLSMRERQVLALIARGATDKAVAGALRLSVNTVKNHVRAIYRKTGVNKRAEAVVWARHHGIMNYVFERK